MDPRVPVSTDNIYKFQATLGLALIVASLFLFVVNSQHANSTIIGSFEKMISIGNEKSAVAEERQQLYQKEIDVAISNREFYNWVIITLLITGLLLARNGFKKWVKEVQPVYDKILKLEEEKLTLEVTLLKAQVLKDSPESGENRKES